MYSIALSGGLSVPCGVVASLWLLGTTCLIFLPTVYPVNKDNMNWTIVVVAGFFLIGAINWIVSARHFFKGPKRAFEKDTAKDSGGGGASSLPGSVHGP